ncbi:MAG: hypothetical protein ABIC04_00145 [Nanoarchaeota archaeon]
MKKGQWDFIISAVIVIAILFGISYFFTVTSWKGIGSFFGMSDDEKAPDGAVFGGCQTAVCSLQALTCGINSVALGKEAWLSDRKHCPGLTDDNIIKSDNNPADEPVDEMDIDAYVVADTTYVCCRNTIFEGDSSIKYHYEYVWYRADCPKTDNWLKETDRDRCKDAAIIEVRTPDEIKRDEATKKCDGVLYGENVCLSCFGQTFADKTSLAADKDTALNEIVNAVQLCYSNTMEASQEKACNVFDTKYLIGEIPSSTIGKRLEGTGVSYRFIAGTTKITASTGQIFIYSDPKWLDNVLISNTKPEHLSFEPANRAKEKFSCTVNGFELPQVVTSAEEWLLDYGDPLYLVYYEKFPEGEQKAWEAEANVLFMVGLGARLGLALIPFVKTPLTKAWAFVKPDKLKKISKFTEELLKPGLLAERKDELILKISKLVDNAGDDGLRAFFIALRKGENSILSSSIVDDAVSSIVIQADSLKAGKYLIRGPVADDGSIGVKVVFKEFTKDGKYTDEAVEGILRTDFKNGLKAVGIPEEAAEESAKNFEIALKNAQLTDDIEDIARQSLSKVQNELDEFAEQSIKSGLMSEQLLIVKKVGFKKAVKAHFSEDSFKATQKLLEKTDKSFKRIIQADPDFGKQLVEKTDETVKMMFAGDGRNIGDLLLDPSMRLDQGMKILAYSDDWAEALVAAGILIENPSIVKSSMKKGYEYLSQFIKSQPQEIRSCLIHVSTVVVGGVSWYTADGETAIRNALVTAGVLHPLECLSFVKNLYIPMLGVASYIISEEDAKNQKFVPIGGNKIGVMMPKKTKGDDVSKVTYDVSAADDYFISLIKESYGTTRFYLASPCKADIQLFPSYTSFDMYYGDYVYTFKDLKGIERFVPIEKQNSMKESVEPYYTWDKATPEERLGFAKNGQNFGESYWSSLTFAGNQDTNIHDVITRNTQYLKIAYKFVYNVYPDADHSFFYSTIKYNVPEFDILLKYPKHQQEYNELSEKIKKIVEPEKKNDKIINRQFECYKKLLDSLANYSVIHIEDEKSVYQFECGGQKLEAKSYLVDYLLNKLNGPAYVNYDPQYQIGLKRFFYSGETRFEQPGMVYREYQKGSYPQTSKIDWDSVDAWDRWVIEYNAVQPDIGPVNGVFVSGFFDHVAKQAAHHLYIFKGDKSNIVKKINNPVFYKTPPQLDENNKIVRLSMKTTIPSISIKPIVVDGYCFAKEYKFLKVSSELLNWASIGGGIYLLIPGVGSGISIGTELLAIGADLVLHYIQKWP